MSINFDVADGLNRQINQAVLAQQREHVVKERDAGGNIRAARAVEIDRDTDVGFRCFAVLACGACIHSLLVRRLPSDSPICNGNFTD